MICCVGRGIRSIRAVAWITGSDKATWNVLNTCNKFAAQRARHRPPCNFIAHRHVSHTEKGAGSVRGPVCDEMNVIHCDGIAFAFLFITAKNHTRYDYYNRRNVRLISMVSAFDSKKRSHWKVRIIFCTQINRLNVRLISKMWTVLACSWKGVGA